MLNRGVKQYIEICQFAYVYDRIVRFNHANMSIPKKRIAEKEKEVKLLRLILQKVKKIKERKSDKKDNEALDNLDHELSAL